MKKSAAFLLLFLFLFTNSGMAVNVHWCRGKITSIKFFGGDEHTCKCGKKTMKRSCCKDKTVVFKATTDPAKVNQYCCNFSFPKAELTTVVLSGFGSLKQPHDYITAFYYPPPFKPKTAIYLLDRAFRV